MAKNSYKARRSFFGAYVQMLDSIRAGLRRVAQLAGSGRSERRTAMDLYRARRRDGGDRARWKRWYKANQKHQRRMRAARQAGINVAHVPSSLELEWID